MEPHSGWLEIHPVDEIRRSQPSSNGPRRSAFLATVCAPVEVFDAVRKRTFTARHRDPRPSLRHRLRFTELVDGRFTDTRNLDGKEVRAFDDRLEIAVAVHSSGTS